MKGTIDHRPEIREDSFADALRLYSICIDCMARLSSVQSEATWALLTQQMRPLADGVDPTVAEARRRDTRPRDEFLYCVGEAHRALVDAQMQLRLLLEEPSAEAPAAGARRAPRHAPGMMFDH